MTPIEAIRVGSRSARRAELAPLGERLRLPGPSIAQMPLRNVVRAPRRTLMTVLGIAAVVTAVVAFLGVVDSFLATVDRSQAEIAQRAPDRLTVTLDGFHPDRSPHVSTVERTAGVAAAEPATRASRRPRVGGGLARRLVGLIDLDSAIWRPTVLEGSAPARASRGSSIAPRRPRPRRPRGRRGAVRHPVRAADGSVHGGRDAVRGAGIHPNPFRFLAYLHRPRPPAMGSSGLANQISVVPGRRHLARTIARALFGRPPDRLGREPDGHRRTSYSTCSMTSSRSSA